MNDGKNKEAIRKVPKKKITFAATYRAVKVIFIRSRLLNDLYYISLKTSSQSCFAASTQEP